MTPRIELVKGKPSEPLTPGQGAFLLMVSVLGKHPELGRPKSRSEDRFGTILNDLDRGKAWGPMSILDGPANGGLDHQDSPRVPQEEYVARRDQARAWTRSVFTQEELGILTAGIVDFATNPSEENARTAPGYARGHSLLLEHMVEKPDSIFTQFLTPEAPKVLANGAFWEELGYAHNPLRVERILRDHTGDLDPALASQFIPLYERNRKLTTSSPTKIETDMKPFTTEGLMTYLAFIKAVSRQTDSDGNPAVKPELVDQLITPFLLGTLAQHPDDPDSLRFQTRYDFDHDKEIPPEIPYYDIFKDRLVRASIARSQRTQNILGIRLSQMLGEKWGEGPGPESALYVLDQMQENAAVVMRTTLEALLKEDPSVANRDNLAEMLDNMSGMHPIAEVGLYILDEIAKAEQDK